MTRSVLRLPVPPDRVDELVALFSELGVLEAASTQPGFLGAELLVPPGARDHILVTALWDSREAYQGWLDSPVRESFRGRLEELLAGEPEGEVYEIVQSE